MARLRLGDMLVKVGLIDEMQLQSALAHQRQWGGKLGDALVNNGFLDEMMLWRGLSKQLGVPLVSLPEEKIIPGIEKTIPVELCEKHQIFPLRRDDRTLTIATSDPNNVGGIDEVAFRIGARLKVVLAPDREIEWAIRRYYRGEHAPCPPPRVRRTADIPRAEVPVAPPGPVTHLGHQTSTSAAELQAMRAGTPAPAPMAPPSPSLSPSPLSSPAGIPPTAPTPGSLGWSGGPQAPAEPAIRETAHLLRFLVESCVQRGVFTREEYLQKLRSLS